MIAYHHEFWNNDSWEDKFCYNLMSYLQPLKICQCSSDLLSFAVVNVVQSCKSIVELKYMWVLMCNLHVR